MTESRPFLLCTTLLAIALGIGCSPGPRARTITSEPEQVAARQLWSDCTATLLAGQRQLTSTLERIDREALVFRLAAGGITQEAGPPTPEQLSDDRWAVFFLVRGRAGQPDTWAYFDPRTVRVLPLDDARTMVDTSDLAVTGSGCSVVRAVAARDGLFGTAQFDLRGFDFTRDETGRPVPAGCRILLRTSTQDESSPVVLRSRDLNEVIAIRQRPGVNADDTTVEDSGELIALPLSGGEARSVCPGSRRMRLPRVLADGSLVVAVQEGDHWLLQTVDPHNGALSPLVLPQASPSVGMSDAEVLLGIVSSGDKQEPAVFTLPRQLDLRTVLALVEAQHPAINRRRALLAAALAEAGRLRLAPLPTLSLGLLYTPVTGILVNGTQATGDVLAEGFARGLLGLTQPLLDWEVNEALAQGGAVRAQIAHDLLAAELNDRLAEAATDWYRLAGYQRRQAADRLLAENSAEAAQLQVQLDAAGETTRAARLSAERDASDASGAEMVAEIETARLRNRLREACGLPLGTAVVLDDRLIGTQRLSVAQGSLGHGEVRYAELRRLAVLNQPEIAAARRAIAVQAFDVIANRPDRPTAIAGAEYGRTRDVHGGFTEVEDYIGLSLTGKLPLSRLFDGELVAHYDAAMVNARRLEAAEVERRITARIGELLVEQRKARTDLELRERELVLARERLRVARLVDQLGPARTDRPPGPDVRTARSAYFRTIRDVEDARVLAASQDAQILGGVGMATRLVTDQAATLHLAEQVSVWIWHSAALIGDRPATERFLAWGRAHGLTRAYVYVGARGELTGDASSGTASSGTVSRLDAGFEAAERLALFVDRCAAQGVAVWALCGEPEWLYGSQQASSLGSVIASIERWNRTRGPLEPRLAGVKLDLEPRSDQRWQDPSGRMEVTATYLAALTALRSALPDVPLWVDLPPALFAADSAATLARIHAVVDGATLMAYDRRPEWIEACSREALVVWHKPLEIGLELSPHASPAESLAGVIELDAPSSGLEALRQRLITGLQATLNFQGLAFHDWEALDAAMGHPAVELPEKSHP